MAVTNKCSLNCEHCFEWEALNKKETLSEDMLVNSIERHQERGLGQIFFTGGEPLNRTDTLLRLLKMVKDAETWIFTSGWHLTEEKARTLKAHKLTGAAVSLDHYLEDKHNAFRGQQKSYHWALNAVKNAQAAGLLTTLSLCPTNDFLSTGCFKPYMDLAKQMKVNFVQIIEPKKEGRYAQSGVCLTLANRKSLENLFLEYSSKRRYRSFPILVYVDYMKRLHGCKGNNERHRYIDTEGVEHPCPFCKNGGKSACAAVNGAVEAGNGCGRTYLLETDVTP